MHGEEGGGDGKAVTADDSVFASSASAAEVVAAVALAVVPPLFDDDMTGELGADERVPRVDDAMSLGGVLSYRVEVATTSRR